MSQTENTVIQRLPIHLRAEFERMASQMVGYFLMREDKFTELDHEGAIEYLSELLNRNSPNTEGEYTEAAIENLRAVLRL
ncbi:MAG: hypothetical protein GC137_06170 [Alphaproteobacteria bacterium]|nr:hypothetical protein [Alphaproteobacteria bacterium]